MKILKENLAKLSIFYKMNFIKKKIKIIFLCLLFALVFFLGNNVLAQSLTERVVGRILLQVEENGEAWYVNPADKRRYFMGRPEDAFALMRKLGVGITDLDLEKIPMSLDYLSGPDSDGDGLPDLFEDAIGTDKYKKDSDNDGFNDKDEIMAGYDPRKGGGARLPIDLNFATKQKGKILLQVQNNGEAWYVNPVNNHRYFLGRPHDAFTVMRMTGLGISNKDLNSILKEGESGQKINSLNLKDKPFLLKAPEQSQAWDFVKKYKHELNKEDVNYLNVINHFFYDPKKFLAFINGECNFLDSAENIKICQQSLMNIGCAKDEINNLDEKKIIIYEDNKQAVILENQKEEQQQLRIFVIKNKIGQWKVFRILLADSGSFITTNDSDGDTWWDEIEIMAGTNPNDKNDNPHK